MFSKRTTLEKLQAELADLDADVAAIDAQAREVDRKRVPGAGFDPSVRGSTDDALRKLAEQRSALMARRSRIAPAVAALGRQHAAQAKLATSLAAAGLPADPTEARAALDGALAEGLEREAVARRLHEHAARVAGQAEADPLYHVDADRARGPRVRSLSDGYHRNATIARRQVEALAAAALALDEAALLDGEAERAVAGIDAPAPKRRAA